MKALRCGVCLTTGTSYAMMNHCLLKADHEGSFLGPFVFRYRVVGWFHSAAYGGEVQLCSRSCLSTYLDRVYYDHLYYCRECNYDKDCFICEADDGTCTTEQHACNCPKGPGIRYGRAGWGYHTRKRIERLKRKELLNS